MRDGQWTLTDFQWTATDANIHLRSEHGAQACTLQAGSTISRHITVGNVTGIRIGGEINGGVAGFTFTGGNATGPSGHGGAIWISGSSDVSIEDCVFDANRSSASGGAVCVYNASAPVQWTGSIRRCSFRENSSTGSGSGGGAVRIASPAQWSLELCAFQDNYHEYVGQPAFGGALWASTEAPGTSINGCTFSRNLIKNAPSASAGALGGGVALHGTFAGKFNDNTLSANVASSGGGLYVWYQAGGSARLSEFKRNAFSDNVALIDGGGMHTDHAPGTARIPVHNCQFVGNIANRYGGGAFFYHTTHDMQHCVFAWNRASAGAGLWIDLRGAPTNNDFRNVTFVHNEATVGAGIAVGRTSAGDTLPISASVSNCIFAFNAGPAYEELTTTNITTTLACNDAFGNDPDGPAATCMSCFSVDPSFCGAEAGPYSLLDSSPCASAPDCGLVGAIDVGCNNYSEYTNCTDTWLDQMNPTTNYSQSDSLRIGAGSTGVLRFGYVALPNGVTVDSAAVQFEVVRWSGSPSTFNRKCLRSAIMTQATWWIYRFNQVWGQPGALAEATDYGTTKLATTTVVGDYRPVLLGPWSANVLSQNAMLLVLLPASDGDLVLWACGSGADPRLRIWYSP
ncbi:MAG: right-handed parallel beta-helix repeat-containing protein [Candidatus Eisenbacteria bacterium]|nr:right-handed parallel beta-helix repeat-containing protein [Candidatus Eisenbacteria bacterium]